MEITKETVVTATMTEKEHRELLGMLRDFRLDQQRLNSGQGITQATPNYMGKLEMMIDRLGSV